MLPGLATAVTLLLTAWSLGRRFPLPACGALLGNVLAAALGMGALSFLILGLGMGGRLESWVFQSLLLAGSAVAIRDLWHRQNALRAWGSSLRLDGLDMAQACAAVLLVLPMAAGLFALPLDYDALEYHLGVPAAYLRAGRVSFLSDNAYAGFPQQQEMLYLAGLAATGTHAGGAASAKAMNLACWMLTAAALVALGRRHGCPRGGIWAALALLASPFVFLTGGWLVYNEPGLALFSTLAASAALEEGKGWAGLAGLLAGLAFGVKYPAALFVVLPLGVALGFRSRRMGWTFLLSALAAASPWLLRDLVATGNPVYPLLGRWLPSPGMDPARFDPAHAPGPADWSHLLAALGDLGSGMLVAPALLVFLLFGWRGDCPGRAMGAAALAWITLGIALWFLFTHRVDRFLLLFVPMLCLAIGFGVEALARRPGGWIARAVTGVVLAFAAFAGLMQVPEGLRQASDPPKDATYSTAAIAAVNSLPAGSRVLFIGEAETFYVRLDGSVRVTAPTVFNDKPFEAAVEAARAADGTVDWSAAAAYLKRQGFTHLYLNWPELIRLQTTYGDRKRGYSRLIASTPAEPPGPADNIFDKLETVGLAKRVWEDGGGRWRILAL